MSQHTNDHTSSYFTNGSRYGEKFKTFKTGIISLHKPNYNLQTLLVWGGGYDFLEISKLSQHKLKWQVKEYLLLQVFTQDPNCGVVLFYVFRGMSKLYIKYAIREYERLHTKICSKIVFFNGVQRQCFFF